MNVISDALRMKRGFTWGLLIKHTQFTQQGKSAEPVSIEKWEIIVIACFTTMVFMVLFHYTLEMPAKASEGGKGMWISGDLAEGRTLVAHGY